MFFKAAIWSGYCFYLSFAGEETEAQGDKLSFQRTLNYQSQDFIPAVYL